MSPKLGHGDHWLAVLEQDDARLRDMLMPPLDAGDGVQLHRTPLTDAVDAVKVTVRRRLVTAYPEPRATALVHVVPRALSLWETRVEGWLTAEHAGAGALTLFPTDLAEAAPGYQRASTRTGLDLELAGLAYLAERPPGDPDGPARLQPAARKDARFLPDDYWFEGDVVAVHPASDGAVVDLRFQGGLELPVTCRVLPPLAEGARLQGYLWLTGRLPTA